jgi:hypothetical protein
MLHTFLTEWALALVALACLIGAALAATYVPIVGRTLAACLIALGCALGAYDLGYRAASSEGSARLRELTQEYDDASQKAIIAQMAKDREEAAANAKAARDALDKLAAEGAATKADLADAEARIDDAPADKTCAGADAAAPAVLIDAIRGRK